MIELWFSMCLDAKRSKKFDLKEKIRLKISLEQKYCSLLKLCNIFVISVSVFLILILKVEEGLCRLS